MAANRQKDELVGPLQHRQVSVLSFVGCLSLIFRAGLGVVKAACVERTASRGQWISVWDSQLGFENQKHGY